MAFEIIQEFKLFKSTPLDFKTSCADQTARLLLPYPFKGLRTKQADTGQIFEYIGTAPSNTLADWQLVPTVLTGAGTPANTLGVISDIYIDETNYIAYKKTGVSTWTVLFSISGAKILTGAGVPSDGADGSNGDMYIRSNGDVYTKETGTWTLQFNIRGTDGQSDIYATTSTTSVDLGTATFPFALTVDTGLSYTAGQGIIVASRANPDTDYFTAVVDSYITGTGVLTLASGTLHGTSAHTDWDVNLAGSPGKQGKAFSHTESNINLTAAKITAVQGGTWTPIDPWSASVQNDTRSTAEKSATAGITGTMTGHSILYNGSAWVDNGNWVGPQGPTGPTGPTGATGATGPTGPPGSNAGFPKATSVQKSGPTHFDASGYVGFSPYSANAFDLRGNNFILAVDISPIFIANSSYYRPKIKYVFQAAGSANNRVVELGIIRRYSAGGSNTVIKTMRFLLNLGNWEELIIDYIDTGNTAGYGYYLGYIKVIVGDVYVCNNFDYNIEPSIFVI